MQMNDVGDPKEVVKDGSTPEVFISYSYDTPAHKAWVARLSNDLCSRGAGAVLDQWELGPGSDLYLFMSTRIPKADRVCVVCTPNYKRKAQAGKGGVGYEGAVINAELLRDQSTDKFIPILVSGSAAESIPDWLGTKVYVDFTGGAEQYMAKLEELVRAIRRVPQVPKPTIGPNPYNDQMATSADTGVDPQGAISGEQRGLGLGASIPEIPPNPLSAADSYALARRLIRIDDAIGWQDLAKQNRRYLTQSLSAWRQKAEADPPKTEEQVLQKGDEAVRVPMPMIASAIAAVESARDGYRDQRSLMDDLLNIPGWRHSGLTVLVQVPKSIIFVYAYLYGATCLNTRQVRHAIELAQMRLALPLHDDENHRPLWQCREIVGWPKSLSGNCKKAFDYVLQLPEREDWLYRIFVQPDDYAACVLGFNLLLSVTELTELLGKEGGAQTLKSSGQIIYDVPPMFVFGETDLILHAFHMAFHDGSAVDSLASDFAVPSSLIREYWPLWVKRAEGVAFEWARRFPGRVPTELPCV